MLWLTIAKPVLDFLGYEADVPQRLNSDATNRPNITWCTTGPLSFLPIHAAGDYTQPGCSLFDYVISSFTPTLSALLVSPPDPASASRVLAIGQTHTPGLLSLPGTTAELDQIQTQTRGTQFTRLEDNWATTGAAVEAIHSHGWVHFACHASQNTTKPTASAFHLHDGSLTLARIAQMQLKNADLAFLSACQTATGDAELPEEAVHLAAGMLMAGYKRVVATMWSIDDQDAPLVAEKFYAYMLNSEMPSERKAAKALHYAIQCLRDKVGVKEFERWVPYVHIGL
ncbi:hypothetical protein FRC12_009102 [Ceratobasidium sp. 428]|nr:hypothetical protein FRC12_009102 [Ceratobasidium sp. 428]